MEENESVRHGGRVNHGGHASRFHSLVGGDQTFHQAGQVFRLRACEMDSLLLPGNRLADIVLVRPVVGCAESGIDNAVLQLDQPAFLAEVFTVRRMEQGNETLGSRGLGLMCSISKFEVIAQSVARPISRRICLFDHAPDRVDPTDPTGRDK